MAAGAAGGHRGSISEQIYLSTATPPPSVFHSHVPGRSRCLTSSNRIALPLAHWPLITARVSAGESLRALGREYGVSHECIRRIARIASADLWQASSASLKAAQSFSELDVI